MSVKVPQALIDAGIISTGATGPAVLQLFRKASPTLRDLHNRVVKRTGLAKVVIRDSDPTKPGAQRAEISVAQASSDPHVLAAQWGAMIVVAGVGAIYLDEARRMLAGQPVKRAHQDDPANPVRDVVDKVAETGKGIVDAAGRLLPKFLDAEPEPMSEKDMVLMQAALRAGRGYRSIVGVDDAAIIGAILTVGVAFLVAAIPVVLPLLFELAQKAFKLIGEKTGIIPGDPPPAKQGPPPSMIEQVLGFVQANALLLAAGVGVIAGAWYLAKRK